jgi:ABC-2 type transport system permease protein
LSSNSKLAPKPGGNTLGLFATEITVLFRRRRTWALLGAIALIPIFLAIAVFVTADQVAPGQGPPFLDRVTQNGLFVGFTAMILALPLFLPLAMGVIAGDTIAGEAGTGTLRYLIIAPAGRVRLLLAKFFGTIVFSFAATITLMTAGGLIGAALFPVGPVTLLSGDVISVGESIARMALVALYVTVSLIGFSAIGLFVSTLTVVPVGAMATTVVLSGVSQILDNIPQLEAIQPYLFTHYWLGFGDLLRQPIDFSSFASNILLQAAYVAIFGALAYSRFTTKDILS